MGYFSLGCIQGNPLYVDGVGCIFRDGKDIGCFSIIDLTFSVDCASISRILKHLSQVLDEVD